MQQFWAMNLQSVDGLAASGCKEQIETMKQVDCEILFD